MRRPILLLLAISLGGMLPAAAQATYTARNADLVIFVETGNPHPSRQPVTITAEVDNAQRSVPVSVEVDEFPYDGRWAHVGSGATDATTERVDFRHRPVRSARYRLTNDETRRQVDVEIGVALMKSVRTRCPGRDPTTAERTRCTMRVDVRGPVGGRRIRVRVYRDGADRPSRAMTKRLRRVRPGSRLHRARFVLRLSRFDGAGVCLLGTDDDGFADQDPFPGDDKDCTFDIG